MSVIRDNTALHPSSSSCPVAEVTSLLAGLLANLELKSPELRWEQDTRSDRRAATPLSSRAVDRGSAKYAELVLLE